MSHKNNLLKMITDPGCIQNVNESAEWLRRNLQKFSIFASLEDLMKINKNFSGVSEILLNHLMEKLKDNCFK